MKNPGHCSQERGFCSTWLQFVNWNSLRSVWRRNQHRNCIRFFSFEAIEAPTWGRGLISGSDWAMEGMAFCRDRSPSIQIEMWRVMQLTSQADMDLLLSASPYRQQMLFRLMAEAIILKTRIPLINWWQTKTKEGGTFQGIVCLRHQNEIMYSVSLCHQS